MQRATNKIGGAERDRTVDLLTASQALSQLSYSPTKPVGPCVYNRLRSGVKFRQDIFERGVRVSRARNEPSSPRTQ